MEGEVNYLLPNSKSTYGEKVGTFERLAMAVLEEKRLSLLLEGGTIELRSFREGDVTQLGAVANNYQIAQNFIGFPYPYTMDDAKAWVANNKELTPSSIGLAIIYRGTLVGGIHLEIEREGTQLSGVLSFWLGSEYTRNGIMQKSAKAFCEYIFTKTQIQEVQAQIFCSNTPSRDLISKLGFILTEEDIPIEKDGETVLENKYILTPTGFERMKYINANINKIREVFINFEDFIGDYLSQKKGVYSLRLRNGAIIHLRARNEEVSDIDIVSEIFVDRDYDLTPLSEVEGPVVVDIGAQIGIFSLYAASELKNPEIYSYEPFPPSYALLSKNAGGNPIRHFSTAVSKNTGTARLFVSPSNAGGHSMVYGENVNTVTVKTISLRDLMERNHIANIDLLKMDCEGSEYEILFSLDGDILSRISNIYMEVHYNDNLAQKYGKYSMVDFLRRNGFEVKILKEFYYEGEGEFYVIFAHNCKGELQDNKI